MREITTVTDLRETVRLWRRAGESIALVPTMGALHAGHLQLVREAASKARHVVVSIFVNPTQFGPNEDFNRYPRPIEEDLALLRRENISAVWVPSVDVMYPEGFATKLHVSGLSEGLCGASRPGHFDGVATVVAKLLLQVSPDIALFGEKDYQQLCVIRRLVMDLGIPVDIIGVPTIREADGLALSSRNRYLSPKDRQTAPQLYAILSAAADQLRIDEGAFWEKEKERVISRLLTSGFSKVDYCELCAEDTLLPQQKYSAPARLLAAVWLDKTRLIDNITL